jgi:hypothetical protein
VLSPSSQLVAVVRAGPYRLAIPAGQVLEVARLEPGMAMLRDRPVVSLGPLLGLPASPASEWALRLAPVDAPALGVERMDGVLDASGATVYHLPAALGVAPESLFRGAEQLEGSLALEVHLEELCALKPWVQPVSAPWSLRYAAEPAERALVCVVAGRSMGFSLPHVLSVIATPAVAAVPRVRPGVRGVLVHAQSLYPVLDAGAVLFGRETRGDYGVVIDMEGATWVVLADAVLGVRTGFRPVAGDQPGWMEGQRGERALFPLFPSDAARLASEVGR